MTAIIRVKRHLQDDPVEAVRLEYKRRRTEEDGDSPSFEKVLNFVGTVDKEDDCVAQRTLAISSVFRKREREKLSLKNRKTDVTSKMRQETKERSEKNRYKVISCIRSVQESDEPDSNSEAKLKDVTIFDVCMEKKSDESGKEEKSDTDETFVYDIYSTSCENENLHEIYLNNGIGIEPYTSHTVFDMEYRNPEDYADEVFDPEDDDSNDENNWRNDYPDEEESDSEEIDVLTCKFEKFGGGDGPELSSDEGEENYPNYDDHRDRSEYYCYDSDDGDLRGSRYEKYRRNVIKSFAASESFDGDEEDEETF